MYKHDVEGGIRTKVLAELMHHMVSLHGKHENAPSAHLPDPSGGSKHDPAKISLHGGMADPKIEHEPLSGVDPDMNDEGREGEHEDSHVVGDLFGRKKKSGMMEF